MDHICTSADTAVDHDGYDELRTHITQRIASVAEPLFTTDATGLFSAFLAALPAERRQHYTCHACRDFFDAYGGLVTIADDGSTAPLLWDVEAVGIMRPAVATLAKMVRRAKVTGVFVSSERVWGRPVTGAWSHFAGTPPAGIVYNSRTLTAGQRMAELREDYGTLQRGLAEFSAETVGVALTLLDEDDLYRAERIVGPARWLAALHEARRPLRGNRRANVTWRAVATAPAGFAHVRSTMIGTLLEDIAAGKEFRAVAAAFAAKMHPLRYQRPQAAPKAGAVAAAEKLVVDLGSAEAFHRRIARLSDLEILWAPRGAVERPAEDGAGIFGQVKTRDQAPNVHRALETRPAKRVDWAAFAASVLPTATRIALHVSGDHLPFYAYTTAIDPEAPPILQWDREGRRNPVSWYTYISGSSPRQWGLSSGYVEVTAISVLPCHWSGQRHDMTSPGALFVLEGCRESRPGHSGLFPETLRSGYHGARAVIEQYNRQYPIEERETGDACGIMLRANSTFAVNLRVTTSSGVREYTLVYE